MRKLRIAGRVALIVWLVFLTARVEMVAMKADLACRMAYQAGPGPHHQWLEDYECEVFHLVPAPIIVQPTSN